MRWFMTLIVALAVMEMPPVCVNFTALPARLSRIWRTRSASPVRGGNAFGSSICTVSPLAPAWGAISWRTASMTAIRSTGSTASA